MATEHTHGTIIKNVNFFTGQLYASLVYAIIVCLSGTSQYCIKMAKLWIMQTMPHNHPWTHVIHLGEIQTGSPPTGSPNANGVSKK